MASKSTIVRMAKIKKTIDKYADLRRKLKAEGDYAGLQKLPRDASPTRYRNLCALTGRSRSVYRKFGISPD
jgi:small subunit ribosomal protein S14